MCENPILKYYGLTNTQGIIFQSFENRCGYQPEKRLIRLLETQNIDQVLLFISLKAKTIFERRKSLSFLFEQRFGLCCNLLFEHQIKTADGIIRACAVIIHCNQYPILLNLLYKYSSYSFAVISKETEYADLYRKLLVLMGDGLLTPKVIKEISNTVLSSHASLVHILRGYDGYSINYFTSSRTVSQGTEL